MRAKTSLIDLKKRREILCLEAELHRAVLKAESSKLRFHMIAARHKMRAATPWITIGATIAGLLGARKKGAWGHRASLLFSIWRWLQKFRVI